MTAMIDSHDDECIDENGRDNNLVGMNMHVVFNDIEKNVNDEEKPFDDEREKPFQENKDSCYDQEDLDHLETYGEGNNPNPIENKLKIKKSLLEFRCKVEDSILGNYLLGERHENLSQGEIGLAREKLRDITLWGVPLLPSKAHEGTDIILMKFLKTKDYKVNDAFDMLQKTMIWRIENNIDGIMDEEFDFENAGFLKGKDREGRPVCYHVRGFFRDKLVYKVSFGTQEKRDMFFRWGIQLMEKAIKKLSFREGGVDSILQIYDLRNTPAQGMKELHSISKKTIILFQNYYPEIIHKSIVVYSPFWFFTSQILFSKLMSQRNKKRFILARPQNTTETLLKVIAPEHLPVEYGGLRRENDQEFSPDEKVGELKIKANTVSRVEFPVKEPGVTITWDVTVVGWEVSYKEEFIPDDEGSYIVLLQNQNRVGDSTRNSFYINEPGKIVITVANATFNKKKMFYRFKSRTTIPMFLLLS
ncbi:hypothetical protein TanjilG_32394 [Lupinus angustifolius]|uniref:patellin-4-like n=1 Tax=Lupinus angustifolius TaxID=3871 RepID=UPI00090DE677|nr:PREDICTED: patellin-4-like [Lupinus angustifolius]OIV90517.1 hypothetical protein TanjilG_32394 [Lupinus angustifolius]